MKKKKALLAVLLLAVMAFGCALFAACGGGGTKFNVTWTVGEHVTVQVEGYDKLPEKVKDGTELTFTVTAATHYEIDSVTGARKSGQKYIVTVNKDLEIKITAKKIVNSITATGDVKKDYVAGEAFDVTGLVVTATYADNTTAPIPQKEGSNKGYTVSPSVFEGGETEVTVYYEGKTDTVSVTVEYQATIDLNGGTLKDEEAFKEGLNNYTNKNGVITFTYLNVETPIALPTEDDVARAGYALTGWEGDEITSITSETAQNISRKANWEYAGVTVATANIIAEGEGKDAKPYLEVTGQFNEGTTSVKLYLYDGGDDSHSSHKIEFGTISKSADSNDFVAKFDLTKLSDEESLINRWMDIRFGDPANDNIYETLQIHTEKIAEIENNKLYVNEHNYLFTSYGKEDPTLKIYYNNAIYSFGIETTDGSDGEVSVKFVGSVSSEACYGGKITISWWSTNDDPSDSSPIDANGNFSVTLNLSKITLDKIGYAHIVIEDKDGNRIVGGDKETDLASSACNYLPALEEQFVIDGGGNKMINAVTATRADGVVYYIGNSFWDGILFYARNEKVLIKEASLRVDTVTVEEEDTEDGEESKTPVTTEVEVVYLVLSGTYSKTVYKTVEEVETAIKTNLLIDAQVIDNGWTTVTTQYTPVVVVNEDGTFEILIQIGKDIAPSAGDTVFFHKCFGFNGETTMSNNNLGVNNASPKIGDTVTSDGLTYTIGDANTLEQEWNDGNKWKQSLIIVQVTTADSQN